MRAYLPNYQCEKATTLSDVWPLLEKGAKPIAGGTDIMVLFEAGVLQPGTYIDISPLKELKGMKTSAQLVSLGSLTTYSQIRENAFLNKFLPILCESAKEVGALAIQNRGTIGGNIANASPAADFLPGLLVYDAKITLISKRGERVIDYGQFHLGYKKMELKSDELIKSISINPSFKQYKHFWRKVGNRRAQAISKTMIAAVAKTKKAKIEDLKIAFGSVGPIPIRCKHVESFLIGKSLNLKTIKEAKEILTSDIKPIDDIRSSAKYRLTISQNILEEFLCGIG